MGSKMKLVRATGYLVLLDCVTRKPHAIPRRCRSLHSSGLCDCRSHVVRNRVDPVAKVARRRRRSRGRREGTDTSAEWSRLASGSSSYQSEVEGGRKRRGRGVEQGGWRRKNGPERIPTAREAARGTCWVMTPRRQAIRLRYCQDTRLRRGERAPLTWTREAAAHGCGVSYTLAAALYTVASRYLMGPWRRPIK